MPIAFTLNAILFAIGGLFLLFIHQSEQKKPVIASSIQQLLGEIMEGMLYA